MRFCTTRSNSIHIQLVASLLALFLCPSLTVGRSQGLQAQELINIPNGLEAQDLIAVPVYCKKYYVKNYPRAEYWNKYFAKNKFPGMHHGCRGIGIINLARRTINKARRASILSNAINEIDYVLTKAPNETLVIPDLYVYRGSAYMLWGNTAKAFADFEKALQLTPKHLRAYALLSDSYKDIGNTSKALEIAHRGLKFFPTSKSLNRRYKALGGTAAPKDVE